MQECLAEHSDTAAAQAEPPPADESYFSLMASAGGCLGRLEPWLPPRQGTAASLPEPPPSPWLPRWTPPSEAPSRERQALDPAAVSGGEQPAAAASSRGCGGRPTDSPVSLLDAGSALQLVAAPPLSPSSHSAAQDMDVDVDSSPQQQRTRTVSPAIQRRDPLAQQQQEGTAAGPSPAAGALIDKVVGLEQWHGSVARGMRECQARLKRELGLGLGNVGLARTGR